MPAPSSSSRAPALFGRRALRLVLGGLFIYAGCVKILQPEIFAGIIDNYRILPANLVNAAAIFLPWLEVTAGMSLLTGYGVKGGTLIIDILLIVFILAFIANLVRGIDTACGCFSTSLMAKPGTYSYLIRDLLLLAAGVALLTLEVQER